MGRESGDAEWRSQRGEGGGSGAAREMSQKVGGTHGDTKAFDDMPPKDITRITLFHGDLCRGIQVNKKPRRTSADPSEIYEARSLEIDVEGTKTGGNNREYITKVSGRAGALVDYLRVETNLGNFIEAGESKGGEAFEFVAPKGFKVISFAGGYGGHLHNISVRYGKIKDDDD